MIELQLVIFLISLTIQIFIGFTIGGIILEKILFKNKNSIFKILKDILN